MKKLNLFLLVAAAACCLQVFGAYPGNSNFWNKPVIDTALSRTDWVTNITTIYTSTDNPGYAYPIDWDKYSKPIAPGIDHIPAVFTKDGGWPTNMVCHMLRIKLDTPNIRFTGTDRCPEGWGEDMPEPQAKKADGTYYKKRTVRERTGDFLYRNRGSKSLGGKERDARVAFNLAAWLPWTNPTTNLWAEPYTPLYSDGASVSFTDRGTVANAKGDVVPNSMIVIYKDGTAELTHWISDEDVKRIWFCAPAFVAEIVSAGQVPGHAIGIDPRTAMGISQDNKTLYLFFCDGRKEGWSGGCYWHSLSTLLQAMGSWYAINLDGGGSSTLCVWDDASGKPQVYNRADKRDNGSNAAIYYKAPDAMIGTWLYDDMDFLVQDIIDNELPDGETTINVLADTTFTVKHPCIPAGTSWTLWTTNNASIGWEDGVAPQVVADSTVGFRNIRLRTSALSVAAGGKVVLDGATGFEEISTADATGIEIAGSVPTGLRVRCATASSVGEFFGTSSLSLADARAEAQKIICSDNTSLVAEAVEEAGVVKLKWSKIIAFGDVVGKIASSLDHGVVTATVAECVSDYLSGYKLKFTVKSEDGLRSATQVVDFNGAGDYVVDTLGTSDPTICGTGYSFDFTVELVDATGTRVLNSEVASGSMGLGVSEDWFSASAADDSAEGGAWTTKPAIGEGRYAVAPGADLDFAATEPKDARVRFETTVEFNGFITDAFAQQMLESIKTTYSTPHGACFVE